MTDNATVAPWYRQPWFWFLTIFPLAAVLWGVTALVVSYSLDNSMVSDDYSKEGRGINMSIARDELAVELQLAGMLDLHDRSARLTLETGDGAANYPYLILKLYHPTLTEYDRIVQFQRVSPGEYTGQLQEDVSGRWYYDLQGPDNDWRMKGDLQLPSTAPITIGVKGTAQG